jgi:hypothetical protein
VAEAHPRLIVHVVFEDGAEADMPSGRPTLEQLRAWVPAGAEAYVLGPKPFMSFVNRALAEIGIPGSGATMNSSGLPKRWIEDIYPSPVLMPTGRIREVSVLEYGLNECVFLTVREKGHGRQPSQRILEIGFLICHIRGRSRNQAMVQPGEMGFGCYTVCKFTCANKENINWKLLDTSAWHPLSTDVKLGNGAGSYRDEVVRRLG